MFPAKLDHWVSNQASNPVLSIQNQNYLEKDEEKDTDDNAGSGDGGEVGGENIYQNISRNTGSSPPSDNLYENVGSLEGGSNHEDAGNRDDGDGDQFSNVSLLFFLLRFEFV